MLVPVVKPAHDGTLETVDTVEAATPNGLARYQGKPALDQVEP